MDKWKRSSRLIDITQQLITQPYQLLPLPLFATHYGSAKSSISEDLAIIDEILQKEGNGRLETVAGAAGGVRYIPSLSRQKIDAVLSHLCEELVRPERILPGGFLYLSDLLGDTTLLHNLGKIFATVFEGLHIDTIMTVETKGIPLAYATASFLHVPVVIARYDYRVTEGSVVTVNTTGSNHRIRPLSLSKRSLAEGSRVLLIDDFMKAGGTIRGMIELLAEFNAKVVGVGVMVESPSVERKVDSFVSLAAITQLDLNQRKIMIEVGNLYKKMSDKNENS